jgi:hypothetical protein
VFHWQYFDVEKSINSAEQCMFVLFISILSLDNKPDVWDLAPTTAAAEVVNEELRKEQSRRGEEQELNLFGSGVIIAGSHTKHALAS